MIKSKLTLSLMMAGMIAAGAANAQSAPAAGTTNLPPSAGEASTQVNGVPNGTPAGASTSSMTKDAKPRDTTAATSRVPLQAGEASTQVKGNPNANPDDPRLSKSKAERNSEKEFKKAAKADARNAAVMGQTGPNAGKSADTPANNPVNIPSPKQGGTPN